MDSGGIGNDDFGAVACDFYVAVEQAGIAAVDLVDDHAGCAGGEPGVALNPTSGLGVGIGSAVVENGAVALRIELFILVHRHATRCGGLDIDLRRATGGVENGRLFGFWGIRVGHDGTSVHWQDLCRAQREHEREYQRFDLRSGNAVAVACGLRAFTLVADDFGHHVHSTQAFVEDDFVCVLVHDVSCWIQETSNG